MTSSSPRSTPKPAPGSWNAASQVLLSDTVGFVRDLPHNLVASFRATLEEAVHADLLLHVLDVGHPHAQQQFDSVHQVLEEIGVTGKPELLLLNKIDTAEGEQNFPEWRTLHPNAIPISAKTGRGVDRLLSSVLAQVKGQMIEATLEADSANGRLLSFIETHCQILDRQFKGRRIILRVTMSKKVCDDLSRNDQLTVKPIEKND